MLIDDALPIVFQWTVFYYLAALVVDKRKWSIWLPRRTFKEYFRDKITKRNNEKIWSPKNFDLNVPYQFPSIGRASFRERV